MQFYFIYLHLLGPVKSLISTKSWMSSYLVPGLNMHIFIIYHTLSIWLEMEFTSDIFLKTSVCAHYSQTIFKNPAYGRQRISRPMRIDTPIQKETQNKSPEWFGYISIDFICFKNSLWIISANWCFQKNITCELHF